MTVSEKTLMVKTLIGDSDDLTDDAIAVYLTAAEKEIINWRYSYASVERPEELPGEFDMIQIFAVVNGYTHAGAEGESEHNENGIYRTFMYEDMIGYIHAHVIPYAKVI